MAHKTSGWHRIPLLIGLAGIAFAAPKTKALPAVSSNQDAEIITVSYCELREQQANYDGKTVRVKATLLTWMDGSSLYDQRCGKNGNHLEPVFDCDDSEECGAIRKRLSGDTDFDGDVGRVEAVFIGRINAPITTSTKETVRRQLIIKKIEEVRRIPREFPWPYEHGSFR